MGYKTMIAIAIASVIASGAAGRAEDAPSSSTVLRTYDYEWDVRSIAVASQPARLTGIGDHMVLTASLQDTAALSLVDALTGDVRELRPLPLEQPWPRVLQLLTLSVTGPDDSPTEALILASVALVDADAQCQFVAVRTFAIDLTGSGDQKQMSELFRSVCVPFSVGNNAQWESGGAMALLPGSAPDSPEFYLGLGHFQAVRSDWYQALPQAQQDTIGTILHITGPEQFEVVSRGHRNVQGMTLVAVAGNPTIISTEHGPQGGDEINLIRQGRDYGWPQVSLGERYAENDPFTPGIERAHTGFEPPIFYFTPSVAVAPIELITDPVFEGGWVNKQSGLSTLLVGAMVDGSVIKLVFDGAHIVSDERIPVGHRVRSIVEQSGRLLLGTDEGQLLVLTPKKLLDRGELRPIGGS